MSDRTSLKIMSSQKVPMSIFFKIVLPRIQNPEVIVIYTSETQEKSRSPQSSLNGLLLRDYLRQAEQGSKDNPSFGQGAKLRQQGRRKMKEFKDMSESLECEYCKTTLNEIPSTDPLLRYKNKSLDHFIPLSKGGLNDISNFKTCCARCNFCKGDIHPLEEVELWEKFCKWIKFKSKNLNSRFCIGTHRRNLALKHNSQKELQTA